MDIFIVLTLIGVSIAVYMNLYDKPLNLQKFRVKKPFVCIVPNNQRSDKMVTPENIPLHIRRSWKQEGNKYIGYYRTKYGTWKGEIVKRGDIYNVYIFDPPKDKLKHHSRWICFHHSKGKKWNIHLAINPKDQDVGAIIFFVEKTIIESFKS